MGWMRAAWERLALYLPVLLMGVLASGTYWLVRSTPAPLAQTAGTAPRHEPDYQLHQFSVRTFDAVGQLKSEVFGADARHFPDTDTLEIEQVRIRAFDERGALSTATAEKALSSADGSDVQLFGNAWVVREATREADGRWSARMEFRGAYLQSFSQAQRVRSDQPVSLRRGEDAFSADSLDFDNRQRQVLLKGRVRAVLMPAARG